MWILTARLRVFPDIGADEVVSLSITVASLSVASPYCAGAGFNVNYTITGAFTPGNVFTAQLSDASGSFATPVTIGSDTTTAAGAIAVTIPSGTATGAGYLIRVISSTPSVFSAAYGTNLTINALPVITTSTSQATCESVAEDIVLTSTVAGTTYQWTSAGGIANAGNSAGPGVAGPINNTPTATGTKLFLLHSISSGCVGAVAVISDNIANCTTPSTPSAQLASPSTVCVGVASYLTATSSAGATIYWYTGGCGTTLVGTGSPLAVYPSVSTTYYAKAFNGYNWSPGCSSVLVTVNPGIIVTQPVPETVCQGGSTTFGVVATGSPTYQWQYYSSVLGKWMNITIAGSNPTYANWTTATLNVNTVIFGNNGLQFQVRSYTYQRRLWCNKFCSSFDDS